MESARRVWNGDVDMNDGELKKLREQYENHLTDVDKFSKSDCQDLQINGTKLINMFKNDIPYLMNGFQKARAVYHEKFQKQVPNKTLKELGTLLNTIDCCSNLNYCVKMSKTHWNQLSLMS